MKLSQVLAIEKTVKSRSMSALTEINKVTQKQTLFAGISREYTPVDDEGEKFPSENQIVQLNADSVMKGVQNCMLELFDLTLTKDCANQNAAIDFELPNGYTISSVPVTTLLFLEKKISDVRTVVANIPILDSSEKWEYDEVSAQFRSVPSSTARSKKVQKPIVMYDATPEHPAQTQMVAEDVTIGHWSTEKLSGCLSLSQKREILGRIDSLLKAIKFHREEANSLKAEGRKMGEDIFSYLFGDTIGQSEDKT